MLQLIDQLKGCQENQISFNKKIFSLFTSVFSATKQREKVVEFKIEKKNGWGKRNGKTYSHVDSRKNQVKNGDPEMAEQIVTKGELKIL